MGNFFHTILFEPLFNLLIFFYNTIAFHDLGIAIILLTVTVRFVLYPLLYKSLHNQMIMQKIQPDIQKIQHDHKDNREKQAQMMMELWKQHKVSPFSGFLLLLVQLPFIIILYRIFLSDFSTTALSDLYSFVTNPGSINATLLGFVNLHEKNLIIVAFAAILQYYNGKQSLPKNAGAKPDDKGNKMARQMVFLGPIMTLLVLNRLPAAVGVYWATTSIFSIIQQWYISKELNRKHNNGTDQGKHN